MQDPKANMNSNTFIEEWSAYALEHSQSIPDLLLVFLIICIAKSFVLFTILKLNFFNFIK